MKTETLLIVGLVGVVAAAVAITKGAQLVASGVGAVGNTAAAVGNAINPLNNDNVFASTVNNVGAKLSGSPSWSLGGWIYDITHPYDPAMNITPLPPKRTSSPDAQLQSNFTSQIGPGIAEENGVTFNFGY